SIFALCSSEVMNRTFQDCWARGDREGVVMGAKSRNTGWWAQSLPWETVCLPNALTVWRAHATMLASQPVRWRSGSAIECRGQRRVAGAPPAERAVAAERPAQRARARLLRQSAGA